MATIRKRAGRPKPWEARFRDPSGRSRSKSFAKKVDAQRFLTTLEADKLRGSWIDPAAGRTTFAEFADEWLGAQVWDPSTHRRRELALRVHLIPAFGDVELCSIRPSAVQAWVAALSRELAPSHIKLLLGLLSMILADAVEDGMIARNPCQSRAVTTPPATRAKVQPWTVEQVAAATAALPHRYRPIAVVAAGVGLRQSEVFGLRLCDVDFLGRCVEVRQQVKQVKGIGATFALPKGGKTRSVPLSETVAAALSEHLRTFPAAGEGLVFTNTVGRCINAGSFNARTWKPAVEAAGLEPTRANGMHMLRHTYASVLLSQGVSVRALADYLGHNDPAITLRVYSHLMPADNTRAREAVDAVFGARVGQVWAESGGA